MRPGASPPTSPSCRSCWASHTIHFRYNLNFGHFAALRSLTSWANGGSPNIAQFGQANVSERTALALHSNHHASGFHLRGSIMPALRSSSNLAQPPPIKRPSHSKGLGLGPTPGHHKRRSAPSLGVVSSIGSQSADMATSSDLRSIAGRRVRRTPSVSWSAAVSILACGVLPANFPTCAHPPSRSSSYSLRSPRVRRRGRTHRK